MPFKKLGLNPHLVAATRRMHYTEPTPIQAEAIPAILTGRDLIATAQTGTGKTAAFALPLLHRLMAKPRGLPCLILSPTRELAQQIETVCREFAQQAPVRIGLVVGGASMERQERLLRGGLDILVATTGRLIDHLRHQPAVLQRVGVLVLDEADRMFDMGFLPDIRRIIARMPGRRQTLLFSATMPPVIAALAREILKNPASIQIGRKAGVAVGITQAAYPVPEHLKTSLLRHLLRETDMPSLLVFTRTKHSARRLTRIIEDDGFKVAELHGNRTQGQRVRAMDGFRRGDFQVMVATNIAARGLDVDHITHVISFRCAGCTRGLHPSRRPHGSRQGGRGCIHPGIAGGRKLAGPDRTPNRPTPAARHASRFRLSAAAGGPKEARPAGASGGKIGPRASPTSTPLSFASSPAHSTSHPRGSFARFPCRSAPESIR
ncbi:MAG TPA: DEAD/DEAH box helicase [Gemmataceae bacterium]|nr:DEAD/DEAH box helicase [Gemmataceae bacterium]